MANRLTAFRPYLYAVVPGLFQTGLQVSGYQNFALGVALWALTALFLLVAVFHDIREWHRCRRIAGMSGLGSWYFIIPCLVIAGAAIAGAAYGLGLRSSSTPPLTREEPAKKRYFAYDIEARLRIIDEFSDALVTKLRPVSTDAINLQGTIRGKIREGTPIAVQTLDSFSNMSAKELVSFQELEARYHDRFGEIADIVTTTPQFNYFELISTTKNISALLRQFQMSNADETIRFIERSKDFADFETAVPKFSTWIQDKLNLLQKKRKEYEDADVYPSSNGGTRGDTRPETEIIPVVAPYLERAYIHPDPTRGPLYCGIAARDGWDAKVVVEYQRYSASHEWSRRVLTPLAEIERFKRDLFGSIQVQLLCPDKESGQWFWNALDPDGRDQFVRNEFYRGRVTFTADDGLPEHCWFYAERSSASDSHKPPRFMDHGSLFTFMEEWHERDRKRAGSATPLAITGQAFASASTQHGPFEWDFNGLLGGTVSERGHYIAKLWIVGTNRSDTVLPITRSRVVSLVTGNTMEMQIRTDKGYVSPDLANPIPPGAPIYLHTLFYDAQTQSPNEPEGITAMQFLAEWGSFKFEIEYTHNLQRSSWSHVFEYNEIKAKVDAMNPRPQPTPKVTRRDV